MAKKYKHAYFMHDDPTATLDQKIEVMFVHLNGRIDEWNSLSVVNIKKQAEAARDHNPDKTDYDQYSCQAAVDQGGNVYVSVFNRHAERVRNELDLMGIDIVDFGKAPIESTDDNSYYFILNL
jgi:hypothetical protein